MMGKTYHKKTNRSRRKVQQLPGHAVTVELADGKACFQMVLPMDNLLFDVAKAIEQTASQAGMLMMKAMIDEEVRQLAGEWYTYQATRQAVHCCELGGDDRNSFVVRIHRFFFNDSFGEPKDFGTDP